MAATTHVRYHGVVFELDLDVVREAITRHELSEGVTLGQFAEGAGVSRMAIWRLLAGHRVSLPTLARVLRALALNPDVIVRKSDTARSQGDITLSGLMPIAHPETNDGIDGQG